MSGKDGKFPPSTGKGRVHLSLRASCTGQTILPPRKSNREARRVARDERHAHPKQNPSPRHAHAQAGKRPGPGRNGDGRDVPAPPGGGEERFTAAMYDPDARGPGQKDLGPHRAAGHQRHAAAGVAVSSARITGSTDRSRAMSL